MSRSLRSAAEIAPFRAARPGPARDRPVDVRVDLGPAVRAPQVEPGGLDPVLRRREPRLRRDLPDLSPPLTHRFYNGAHDAWFTMRVVGDGDAYGRDMALTHTGADLLVEFYDSRRDHEADPDGSSIFETGITLDGANAWRVGPAGMADCLRALMEADVVPDPEAERQARVEDLTEKIDELMAARLDYAETHKDAGDAYTHLPREGTSDYGNGDQRLAGWMRRVGVDPRGLEIEKVADQVLDNFRMEPGTILDPTHNDDDLFLVDSFPVGEIEERVEKAEIAPDADPEEWEAAKAAGEAHFRGDLAHLSSDRVWYAVISRELLEGLIAEVTVEPDPAP